MSLAQADWQNALRCIVPVAAYCLGIVAFNIYKHRFEERMSQFYIILPFACKEILLLASIFFPPVLASFSLSAACGFGVEEYAGIKNANTGEWSRTVNFIALSAFILGIIAGTALFRWLGALTLLVPAILLLGGKRFPH